MKLLRTFLLFQMIWFYGNHLSGQQIGISLFNELPVKGIVVSSLTGNYKVYCDNKFVSDLMPDDVIYITLIDKNIAVRNTKNPVGLFSSVRFQAVDSSAVIRLNLVSPNAGARQFNDNLRVSVAFNRLLIVNDVLTDNYISGVVEAESGITADAEFYKAQSILARTYLYGHFYRHETEGFQLCDGVHCQAYRGRSVKNPIIVQATKSTSGLVVVGPDTSFITAVFHANCGGQTESASNAWLNGKPYLQPVKDPFCQNSSSSHWTKVVPLDQWKAYLKDHGMKLKQGISPGMFDFTQINRRLFYKVGNDSIPVKQIRSDFQLKSSFFSVVASGKEITIKGRGFGHGVGLCQEGAIQMAKIGYSCNDILAYYYKGIRIVPYSQATKLPASSADKQTANF
jgi:stage II sporulation protein D